MPQVRPTRSVTSLSDLRRLSEKVSAGMAVENYLRGRRGAWVRPTTIYKAFVRYSGIRALADVYDIIDDLDDQDFETKHTTDGDIVVRSIPFDE